MGTEQAQQCIGGAGLLLVGWRSIFLSLLLFLFVLFMLSMLSINVFRHIGLSLLLINHREHCGSVSFLPLLVDWSPDGYQ